MASNDNVWIYDDAYVNIGGPKVTFYVGDNYGGNESFKVNGENTKIIANIMIQKGKFKVDSGGSISRSTFMIGWYVIEKLEANGKYTYWDKYNCSIPVSSIASMTENVILKRSIPSENQLNDFIIYPNPANNEVWIGLNSFKRQQVTLVLLDMLGKTVQQQVIQNTNAVPYRLDVANLPTGLYPIKVQVKGQRALMKKFQVIR